MQLISRHNVFWVAISSAAILIFFGSGDVAFASNDQQGIWVAATGLSRPGIPGISAGENSLKPTWIWEASKSQISGTIHYSVQWCQRADFSACGGNLMYTDINSFSFDFSNQLTNGIWYMRVRAMDEYGHKSAYSEAGLGTIQYYSLVTPYSFTVNLVGNEAKLGWNDCWAANFRVWGSDTGLDGTYQILGETETYGFSSNLGTDPARWFYVTAIDRWGNESPPSAVIKVKIPGLLEANNNSGGNWVAIFEPIWHDFSLGSPEVAGDRTNSVDSLDEDDNGGFLGIIPHDYFKLD